MTTIVYMLLAVTSIAQARPMSPEPMTSTNAAIYGDDNRTLVVSLEYPWRSIGKLQITTAKSRGTCTATLIGQCYIVTAAHCVSNTRGSVDGLLTFHGSSDNVIAEVNELTYGRYAQDPINDWAIGRLSLSLGSRLDWFDLDDKDGKDLAGTAPFNIMGYSRDVFYGLLASLDDSVTILYAGNKTAHNFLYHNGNTSKGSSGASIWYEDKVTKRAHVVGVNTRAVFDKDGKEARFPGTPPAPDLLANGVASNQFYQEAQTFMKSNPCTSAATK